MLQNAPSCTIQKYFFGEACPEPLSKRWATRCKPPKSWPPLANPAYAHGLLLRNLFEEMRS